METPVCLCATVHPEISGLRGPSCLGHLWFFEGLTPEELAAVAGRAERRLCQTGEALFRQGEPAREVALIKLGRVRLGKLLPDGTEITLDLRQAGDFLGEYLFSDDLRYPVSAWCLTETLVCRFTKARFEELILEYPTLGLKVIQNLSQRLSHLTGRMAAFSHTNLEDRLYEFLCSLAREHGQRRAEAYVLQFPLTHDELGFLVGAHRVSVTRALKKLRLAGKVLTRGRTLALPGPLA